MEIKVRGWNRDMGYKDITSIDLAELSPIKDATQWLTWDGPRMFPQHYGRVPPNYGAYFGVEVHWRQELKLTGNYRMEIQFSRSDVLHLFKTVIGSELSASLIEDHGFTISPELVKSILRTVKLSDLTLGDLVAMNAAPQSEEPAAKEKVAEPAKVTPLVRRRF